MPIVPTIEIPNFGQSYAQGANARQQIESNRLANLSAQQGFEQKNKLLQLSEEQRRERQAIKLLDLAQDQQSFDQVINMFESMGGPPELIQRLKSTPYSPQLKQVLQAKLAGTGGKVTPVGIPQKTIVDGKPGLAGVVFDDSSRQFRSQEIAPPSGAGFAFETPQQKRERDVEADRKKAINSAIAQEFKKTKGEERSNAKGFKIYQAGITGLAKSLGNTNTGPGMALLPAVTVNQQIADGAIAAMAPILKQLFRSAGEGTFTDKDQELLLKMVPTRNDLPAARAEKLRNIDRIVRAKLGAPPAEQSGKTFKSKSGITFTVE